LLEQKTKEILMTQKLFLTVGSTLVLLFAPVAIATADQEDTRDPEMTGSVEAEEADNDRLKVPELVGGNPDMPVEVANWKDPIASTSVDTVAVGEPASSDRGRVDVGVNVVGNDKPKREKKTKQRGWLRGGRLIHSTAAGDGRQSMGQGASIGRADASAKGAATSGCSAPSPQ
jgi:hypothetical protein